MLVYATAWLSIVSAEIRTSRRREKLLPKIALMTFDCVRGQRAKYVNGVFLPVHSTLTELASDHSDLVVFQSRFGPCSFHSSALTLWNDSRLN